MTPEYITAIENGLLDRGGHRTSNDGISFPCFEPDRHKHGDAKQSAWWSCTKHRWSCRACDAKGGALDAGDRLEIPRPRSSREVARWGIRNAAGVLRAWKVRLEPGRNGAPKECVWERADGRKGLGGLRARDLPVYGAHWLAKAEPGTTVVVTEGEKATDALRARGVLAVGTVTGAGAIPVDAVLQDLLAYELIFWPDNDDAGDGHMTRIGRRCVAMGATGVRVVDWRDAPPGGDAADFPGDATELAALLAAARPFDPGGASDPESPSDAAPTGLPVIAVTKRPLRDITTDALAAFTRANDPPTTFARGGELVRWRRDEKGVPLIEPLIDAALRGRLTRSADFVKPDPRRTGKGVHVSPPLDVVRDLAALDDIVHAVPALDGIAEIPPLRSDGSIHVTAGYDPATQLVYVPPPGFRLPPIADQPASTAVRDARALVEELVCDFPFVDQASRANALAALLTPFVRQLIAGATPLAIFDKPKQGTGASLLAFAIAQLVTGRLADTLPAPEKPEEWGKLITAALLAGRTFVLIDNVVEPLQSAHLARAITTPVWADRILAESRIVRVPQRAVWFATGNNIQVKGDIPRRSYLTRQDAGLQHPEDRPAERFRHPDLLGWIADERPRLVAAVLTLARHWIVEGRPKGDVPPFGGFEGWASIVGGILALAGIDGFLDNRDAIRVESDNEESDWCAFFAAWFSTFDTTPKRVRDLVDAIRPVVDDRGTPRSTPLRDVLPDSVGDPDHRELGKRLGQALYRRRDQVFGDLRLRQARDEKHVKVATWRLDVAGFEGFAGFENVAARENGLEKYPKSSGGGGEDTPQTPRTPQDAGGHEHRCPICTRGFRCTAATCATTPTLWCVVCKVDAAPSAPHRDPGEDG